jgi:hypothetical protein
MTDGAGIELECAPLNAVSDHDIQDMARQAGLPMDTTGTSEALRRFAEAIADRAATAVDRCDLGDCNAGEEIRGVFGLG